MARKEQIIQAAKQAEKEGGFAQIVKDAKGVNSAYGIGFVEGAEWADKHSIELKEVDLEKEIEKEIETRWRGEYLFTSKFRESAKHFFELGLNASNPIAKENLESFVRRVIDLDIEAGEYYNNIIEEERRENGSSYLMINLFRGTIEAKELGILYVLNKLKTQKGE